MQWKLFKFTDLSKAAGLRLNGSLNAILFIKAAMILYHEKAAFSVGRFTEGQSVFFTDEMEAVK